MLCSVFDPQRICQRPHILTVTGHISGGVRKKVSILVDDDTTFWRLLLLFIQSKRAAHRRRAELEFLTQRVIDIGPPPADCEFRPQYVMSCSVD